MEEKSGRERRIEHEIYKQKGSTIEREELNFNWGTNSKGPRKMEIWWGAKKKRRRKESDHKQTRSGKVSIKSETGWKSYLIKIG